MAVAVVRLTTIRLLGERAIKLVKLFDIVRLDVFTSIAANTRQ